MFDLNETIYIDSRTSTAPKRLGFHLASLLYCYHTRPVFLCIGSDKVRGDSLGPVIGSLLLKKDTDLCVFGTLDFPVHALNLAAATEYIYQTYPGRPLVAIDASLGVREHVKYLTLGRGGLNPGAGVRKSLGTVGDVFLTGIVAPAGPLSNLALQVVQRSTVLSMAAVMTEGILKAL